eukprot:TRINITY_DN36518_c0_g1_i1.p1 TRINITY_DN36518_c0_g1~~TRINITY_DN36518_c0_g1_i1.p1  ORF type:complete len:206 (+),score=48.22 TRINITY_DN36518_c0_g1_i1:58-675(+)
MPGTHGAGCGCVHEEDLTGQSQLLLPWIDVPAVTGLNEDVEGTARRVFRPYDSRLNDEQLVESPEGDEDLILKVPFTSPVKVTGISVIGGDGGSAPSRVKLYINREDLDFTSIEDVEATQEVELVEDFHGAIQFPVRAAKFVTVTQLVMYFPESLGGDRTRIHWVGLWGIGSEYKRQAVVAVYEAIGNAKDNDVQDDVMPTHDVA